MFVYITLSFAKRIVEDLRDESEFPTMNLREHVKVIDLFYHVIVHVTKRKKDNDALLESILVGKFIKDPSMLLKSVLVCSLLPKISLLLLMSDPRCKKQTYVTSSVTDATEDIDIFVESASKRDAYSASTNPSVANKTSTGV